MDILLKKLVDFSEEGFTLDTIKSNFRNLDLNVDEFKTAIAVFRTDKLIEPIFHPEVPDYDMGVFGISEKGIKFILYDGGYIKKEKINFTKETIFGLLSFVIGFGF